MANSSTSPPSAPCRRCIETIHRQADPPGQRAGRPAVGGVGCTDGPRRPPAEHGPADRRPVAYIGRRARTSIRRGLLAAAASRPRRRVRGAHGSVRGLRRQSVPLPGGQVPRRGDRRRLPGLPQGAPDPGELRVRRPPRSRRPARPRPRPSSPGWTPCRRSSPCTPSRCAAAAAGTTWTARTSWVPSPYRGASPAGAGAGRPRSSARQRVGSAVTADPSVTGAPAGRCRRGSSPAPTAEDATLRPGPIPSPTHDQSGERGSRVPSHDETSPVAPRAGSVRRPPPPAPGAPGAAAGRAAPARRPRSGRPAVPARRRPAAARRGARRLGRPAGRRSARIGPPAGRSPPARPGLRRQGQGRPARKKQRRRRRLKIARRRRRRHARAARRLRRRRLRQHRGAQPRLDHQRADDGRLLLRRHDRDGPAGRREPHQRARWTRSPSPRSNAVLAAENRELLHRPGHLASPASSGPPGTTSPAARRRVARRSPSSTSRTRS